MNALIPPLLENNVKHSTNLSHPFISFSQSVTGLIKSNLFAVNMKKKHLIK